MALRKAQVVQATSELLAKTVHLAREPLIDHLRRVVEENKQLKEQVFWLLSDLYFAEFRTIDGLKQHPRGLTFSEWQILRITRKENEIT